MLINRHSTEKQPFSSSGVFTPLYHCWDQATASCGEPSGASVHGEKGLVHSVQAGRSSLSLQRLLFPIPTRDQMWDFLHLRKALPSTKPCSRRLPSHCTVMGAACTSTFQLLHMKARLLLLASPASLSFRSGKKEATLERRTSALHPTVRLLEGRGWKFSLCHWRQLPQSSSLI